MQSPDQGEYYEVVKAPQQQISASSIKKQDSLAAPPSLVSIIHSRSITKHQLHAYAWLHIF